MIDSPAYAKEDPNISMSKYLIINEGIVAWNPYKIEKTVLNEKEVSEVKDSKKQDVQYFVEIGLRYRKAWFN